MVNLYLDNYEVVVSSGQTIGISRENPLFTTSDSYSLNVDIPLDIAANAKFFRGIGRYETQKSAKTYDAVMTSGMGVILKGIARVTKSTESLVKLQLTSGLSAIKMLADMGNLYIDEMDLGQVSTGNMPTPGDRLDEWNMNPEFNSGSVFVKSTGVPFYDATNDVVYNLCDYILQSETMPGYIHVSHYVSACPQFIAIVSNVFAALGYKLDCSSLNPAIERLYILTGNNTPDVAKKLPHWTVAKFIEEVQNFLAQVFVCDDHGNACLKPMSDMMKGQVTELEPVETYEVDYSDAEVKGLVNNNVEFAMDVNNDEVVDQNILDTALECKSYSTYNDAYDAFVADTDDYKKYRTIYKVRGGELYIGEGKGLKRIAPFNPLLKYNGGESVKLSICPPVMIEEFVHDISDANGNKFTITLPLPSIENATTPVKRFVDGMNSLERSTPPLYELISGEATVPSENEKPDIMPVVFVGDGLSECLLHEGIEAGKKVYTRQAFTDVRYKQINSGPREKWSLSLQDLEDCDFCLGRQHQLSYRTNRQCKQKIKFLSDIIPSATDIFVIRNRRYLCEKIDISIVNGEVSRLMTGYFYEVNG